MGHPSLPDGGDSSVDGAATHAVEHYAVTRYAANRPAGRESILRDLEQRLATRRAAPLAFDTSRTINSWNR